MNAWRWLLLIASMVQLTWGVGFVASMWGDARASCFLVLVPIVYAGPAIAGFALLADSRFWLPLGLPAAIAQMFIAAPNGLVIGFSLIHAGIYGTVEGPIFPGVA